MPIKISISKKMVGTAANSLNFQFSLKCFSHFGHMSYCLGVGRSQGVSVTFEPQKPCLRHFTMYCVVVNSIQVGSLLKSIDEDIVQTNTAYKADCMAVTRDYESTQFVAWNLSESCSRTVKNWKGLFHYRNYICKCLTDWGVKQKLPVSFAEIFRDHNHFIKKTSQQMPYLLSFGKLCLSLRLLFLPVRNPNCNRDRNDGAESLQPRGQARMGFDPNQHEFPYQKGILS